MSRSKQKRLDYLKCYIILVPFLILFLSLTVWPIIRTFQFSLYDYKGIGNVVNSPFVGFKNYITVLKDKIFQKAYLNSWIFTIGQSVIKLVFSFLLALLLNQKWLKTRGFFRTIFFLPWLMPSSIVAMVFNYLLNPLNGAVNEGLKALHLIDHSINFFGNGTIAFITIAIISS